ncbi:MAG TPA: von Willebrand factor type A domain-containing protein, partial [Verrucomicrobiae bacterium]|nr:von Willebrand factor type A domain-containing protein [Verrucomicrobiae bacterium]
MKKLHDELQSTIGLVREVEKTPAASAEAALKLSGDRREKLLAHFKTPRPQESFWIRPMKLPALLPVLAVIVIVAVLAGMSLSVLSGAKRKSMGKAGDFEFMSSMKSSSKEETSAATPAPAAPTVVTVATAPVLAAPPAPIVLPAAEPTVAVGGVNASGGEHIAAIGGISGSTQSFYRNVNGLRADSTPATVTEIVAKSKPADSLVQDGKLLYEMGKLEESKDKLNKALAKNPNDAAAAYYLALDDQAASTRDQNSHQADVLLSLKQVEKQQEPSVSPASISGIASASGGAGGLRNQGGGGGGSSQSLSGFASTDFDAQKTQSAALPESIPLGHFPGASTADQPGQFALDKKYDAGEITKGASQLHSTEPASRARRGFSKVTPLPGLRAPAAATYDSPATLAMPDVPANQVLTSGLQQAQPNSTPVAGDIAGNDRSDLGMPASSFDQSKSVNIGNEMKLGSAHSLTDGATVDTFKTGLAQDDTDGLRYIFATNTVASNGMETLDINQALDRYAKLTGKTILRSSLPAAAPIEIQTAVSKETAIQAVQLALAKDNISLVAVGDNIIKAVPQNQANAAGGVPESTLVEIADNLKADKPVRRSPANAPVPQPEVLTTDNAFSTFSLNVSDVSFKLAEASLEKGQMPEAATIRSEEFINA